MKQGVKNKLIAESAVVLCEKLFLICHSEKCSMTSDNFGDFKEAVWAINQLVNGERDFQHFIQNLKEEES